MRWQSGRRSLNIQDRRSFPVKTAGSGGLIFVGLIIFLAGGDPTLLFQGLSQGMVPAYQSQLTPEQQKEQADFVSVVLAGTEDAWGQEFAMQGKTYEQPSLVLFAGATDSACGLGQSAMGPFYCPLDHQIYLDLNFFYDLQTQYGAPGDFARAYVIAHEVGHHVQAQTGVLDKLHKGRFSSQEQANQVSVATELQADCYAGIWAHHSAQQNVLEEGDIDEALQAASQIGDDRLQQQAQGYVVPESFTHGTSAQRSKWFRRGYDTGRMQDCDTFSGL